MWRQDGVGVSVPESWLGGWGGGGEVTGVGSNALSRLVLDRQTDTQTCFIWSLIQ